MKVVIERDERWPDFFLDENIDPAWGDKVVEVTEAFYKKYLKVGKAYNEMQDELQRLYERK